MVYDSINLAEINSKSPGNVCSDSEINHFSRGYYLVTDILFKCASSQQRSNAVLLIR